MKERTIVRWEDIIARNQSLKVQAIERKKNKERKREQLLGENI